MKYHENNQAIEILTCVEDCMPHHQPHHHAEEELHRVGHGHLVTSDDEQVHDNHSLPALPGSQTQYSKQIETLWRLEKEKEISE